MALVLHARLAGNETRRKLAIRGSVSPQIRRLDWHDSGCRVGVVRVDTLAEQDEIGVVMESSVKVSPRERSLARLFPTEELAGDHHSSEH